MSLKLYFHPLSSYCQKVLVALYENDTPFEKRLVNLGDAEDAAAFKRLWPIGKFPVLRDDANDRTIPESSIIIEYLDRNYPGKASLIPDDGDLALETRRADRFYDLCVQAPMQSIVGDRLRPKEARDPLGVEKAKSQLRGRWTCWTRTWRARSGPPAISSAWPTARQRRLSTTQIS